MARKELIVDETASSNSSIGSIDLASSLDNSDRPESTYLDPRRLRTDESFEPGLRPKFLEDFIGQGELKEHLKIVLGAARKREEPSDHILFAGPPGLGKTSLAGIIAHEMGSEITVTSGPSLARPGDLAAILSDLNNGDVIFIDEIHRLSKVVEEVLYPAIEDYKIDIVLGKGPAAKSVRLDLPRFTLVGATTRTGMITGPLRDRFGIVARLDYYSPQELEQIVVRASTIYGIEIDQPAAGEIARRSRGTPRISNRLLRRVRDFAQMNGENVVNLEMAKQGLELFGIDHLGLDKLDRTILETLCVNFSGRPVGVSTLAISIGEEPETIEDAYEPYLVRQGLIQRTPRGRVATRRAFQHLSLSVDTLSDSIMDKQLTLESII